MFKAQANQFDDVVGKDETSFHGRKSSLLILGTLAKATDENLTSENWEYIMASLDCNAYPGSSLTRLSRKL